MPLNAMPVMTTATLEMTRQVKAVLEQSMIVNDVPAPWSVTEAEGNVDELMVDEQLAVPEKVDAGSVMMAPLAAASSMNCCTFLHVAVENWQRMWRAAMKATAGARAVCQLSG